MKRAATRPPRRVLLVDDEPIQRLLLMRALEPLGVEVQEARNGQEALDLLRDSLPHVVLTDLHMPIMDGLELTRRVKALDPLLPVILLTADGDREVRLKGIEAGADDFLNRPVDLAELRLRVKGHLERRKLQEKLEDLERALLALVRAVEAKDAYTAGHGERVAQYALWTAEELGAKPEELEDLHMGALLHDVGKIGIPDHILRGDYALTEHEWRLIREHPVKGDEIIRPLRAYTRLKPYVRWHHEKLDGSGYPDGLTQIPLLVQAVTAADIYDALTSVRTYRKVARPEEALQALENEVRQGRLDREVVRAFKSALLRNRALRTA
ncbi:HD-GYP domain-containing protein [Thermus scotoductus]|uniref:Two-component system response regulator n=1 Tax=Thermus scotoductus TaxID=37636 RepID=A0A430R0Y1_THESC|nr:HD domain-containing phosphohydrolase [Thermus scotoductus]RTG98187.1 two-component system response regulator [Thermus scotoductus]RTH01045.1 two-component system response regulator [Thermus scotoductus]RTH16893.1 two-component system response regulator [Thermus scotoductus]RTH98639.1 two-component system response regulator [Thermus scotoductus]RTI18406.1 two-component system response regulator [Thermus scotoductus]